MHKVRSINRILFQFSFFEENVAISSIIFLISRIKLIFSLIFLIKSDYIDFHEYPVDSCIIIRIRLDSLHFRKIWYCLDCDIVTFVNT